MRGIAGRNYRRARVRKDGSKLVKFPNAYGPQELAELADACAAAAGMSFSMFVRQTLAERFGRPDLAL